LNTKIKSYKEIKKKTEKEKKKKIEMGLGQRFGPTPLVACGPSSLFPE
jgi:hypothetical protein